MRLLTTGVALAAAASITVASTATADDPPTGDDTGAPAAVKISLRQGTGTDRRAVKGFLFSPDPNCVAGQKVTFYRQVRDADGNVISERRAGYVLAEAQDENPNRSKVLRFSLVRSGIIIARTQATDACEAGKSKIVRYRRPGS